MRRARLYFIVIFLVITTTLVWIIPNIFNQKEKDYFSETSRISRAKDEKLRIQNDSITIAPGVFYQRNNLHQFLLGQSYRQIWNIPVKVAVLDLPEYQGGLDTVKFSGSQQTIGIDVKDAKGRRWAVRSVNKDQSKALSPFLQSTFLRALFRDQAASLNPYGALVIPVLSKRLGIHHTNPKIFYFPYNTDYGTYNERMAGRLVLFEEEADSSWIGTPEFKNAVALMGTEEMLEKAKRENIPVDTLLYAKSRMLDILISDWDRHEGNWEWALVEKGEGYLFQPVPMDRDMAFYHFDDGLINKLALIFNNKFQSFTPDIHNIEGLAVQSAELDKTLLKSLKKDKMINLVSIIKEQLSEEVIQQAFLQYPPEIYAVTGVAHENILKVRLVNLQAAIEKFYDHLQGD